MPRETDPTRQYSDREVRLILRSAAELQQRTGSGYLWARHGLRRDSTRYGARTRELIDALAARAHTMAADVVPSAGGPNA